MVQYLFAAIVGIFTLAVKIESLGKSETLFHMFSTGLSLIPGKIGSYARVGFYKYTLGKMSWDVNIGFGSFFTKKNACIGRHVRIGAYCILGSVIIDEQVSIASRVSIPSGKQQHRRDRENVNLESKNTNQYMQVRIGAKAWIGEGAIVLADVGEHCIVGAGSVVTKSVSKGTVVVGNPATNIGDR